MSRHLITIALGPVQDFIAAARRTRDLWYGSHLLSEISKAAALAVHKRRGKLIFPAPDAPDKDLRSDSDLNVANIILAELPEGVTPEEVKEAAYGAAKKCWKDCAEDARNRSEDYIVTSRWEEQVGDVLELYSAWIPLPNDETYKDTRRNLMRLLAGRKACRDFIQPKGYPGVPKSSLDGMRETVFDDPENIFLTLEEVGKLSSDERKLYRSLRLSRGEQLDVVGLTKRLGGGVKGYPSVSRISADPWLRGIPADDKNFKELLALCKQLTEKEKKLLTSIPENKAPRYRHFPYEGIVVYRNRHKELVEETWENESTSDFTPIFKQLSEVVKKLEDTFGVPNPYLAILVADGDRMGNVISNIELAEEHRKFSKQLSVFAGQANSIVEDNNGTLVYSGGDDVLAFLPLEKCLDCAAELHQKFGELKDDANNSPTLSVGLAIGHFMEPLEDLLTWGREAEKHAKEEGKNGLAIHLHTRAGAPIKFRKSWGNEPHNKLTEWVTLHIDNEISDKAAFDLRDISHIYKGWPVETEAQKEALASAIQAHASLALRRKESSEKSEGIKEIKNLINDISCADDLKKLAEEIIIARHIAKVKEQANREGLAC
jgi:CRISPR-associated protein Cmr2